MTSVSSSSSSSNDPIILKSRGEEPARKARMERMAQLAEEEEEEENKKKQKTNSQTGQEEGKGREGAERRAPIFPIPFHVSRPLALPSNTDRISRGA